MKLAPLLIGLLFSIIIQSSPAKKYLVSSLSSSLSNNTKNNGSAAALETFRRFNTRMIENLHKEAARATNSSLKTKKHGGNATIVDDDDQQQSFDTSCKHDGWSSFVRYSRTMIMGVPTVVRTMELSDCVRVCRNNLQPGSKTGVRCKGFNYQDTSPSSCEFFDDQTKIGPLNYNVGSSAYYFEKVCLKEIGDVCRLRSHAFESMANAELKDNALKQITVDDELSCLEACLLERSFVCQSVNYLASTNICELSRFSRRSRPQDFQQEIVGVTYYENNCLTKTNRCTMGDVYFTKNVDSAVQRVTEVSGKKRNESLMTCLNKCVESDSIFCRSVEFDFDANECFISDDDSFSTPEILTLANSIAVDLYEPICLPRTSSNAIPCERPYLFERYFNSALNVVQSLRTLVSAVLEDCLILCVKHPLCKSLNYDRKAYTCWLFEQDQKNSSIQLVVSHDVDYYENNCPRKDSQLTESAVRNEVSTVLSAGIRETRLYKTSLIPKGSTVDDLNSYAPTISPGEAIVNNNNNSEQKLMPKDMIVSAMCSEDGVNITISSSQTYTGAIYAAERFAFCRNLIFSQSSFWLFLPRPNKNTACNTIFLNDQLSGVVVVSNDNIVPYDVTTKDDLFYQITCDYRQMAEGNGKVIVTSGVVVGGPTPRVVASVAFSNNFEANLKILQNGKPVSNVLMGEQLTLEIETNTELQRVMVVNCNVTRIGGNGAAPDPLNVFDNGCPQIPQIFGPFQRGSKTLSATMTAFRIDGSAEIQLGCLVMFCSNSCEPVLCSDNNGGRSSSFGRRKRKTELHMDSIDANAHLLETVNGKLHVYVEGEYGATEILKERFTQAMCIQESTFIVVTVFLSAFILFFLIGTFFIAHRTTFTTMLHQKLLKNSQSST